MNYKLTRINEFLNKKEDVSQETETGIILSGPDTIKNILVNETIKLNKLECVSAELLNYITDSKIIKQLSYKEKQNLLRTITDIQINSRDFIFKVAEMSAKNEFLKEVLKLSKGTEKVISESGQVIDSSITEEDRKHLSQLIRDFLNEETRG